MSRSFCFDDNLSISFVQVQNGQQGLKRQKNLSENSDEVLALGEHLKENDLI